MNLMRQQKIAGETAAAAPESEDKPKRRRQPPGHRTDGREPIDVAAPPGFTKVVVLAFYAQDAIAGEYQGDALVDGLVNSITDPEGAGHACRLVRSHYHSTVLVAKDAAALGQAVVAKSRHLSVSALSKIIARVNELMESADFLAMCTERKLDTLAGRKMMARAQACEEAGVPEKEFVERLTEYVG